MKKTLVFVVAMLLLLVSVGCFELEDLGTIEFVTSPNATYNVGEDVDAAQFKVLVRTGSGENLEFALTNAELVVQGLDGTKLDTREAGLKTVKVTYKTISVSAQYEVVAVDLVGWQEEAAVVAATTLPVVNNVIEINNATDFAVLAKLVNNNTLATAGTTVKLNADIDLQNKPWTPVGANTNYFKGNFDGNGHTVSNLKVVATATTNNNHAGLFGAVTLTANTTFTNVTLNNVNVNITSPYALENAKNIAALVGYVAGTSFTFTVSNVTVTNATVRGNGRVAALVGQTNSVATFANNTVTANLSAYNPVFVADADGEGDKVGGLVGQAQKATDFNTNTVNVIVNATRDAGGLVGYSVGGTFNANVVSASSTIQATVAGGFIDSKGTCNAGGLVGTVAVGAPFVFTANQVNTTNILADSVQDSSFGKLFGGIRRLKGSTVTIDGTDVVISDAADFAAFVAWQATTVGTYSNR